MANRAGGGRERPVHRIQAVEAKSAGVPLPVVDSIAERATRTLPGRRFGFPRPTGIASDQGPPSMIAKLIVASGKNAGRAISIKRNKLLIGRAEECDVRPLSEEVSRRHCAVHAGPEDVFVEDLGSRNGTFVNGVRITQKT